MKNRSAVFLILGVLLGSMFLGAFAALTERGTQGTLAKYEPMYLPPNQAGTAGGVYMVNENDNPQELVIPWTTDTSGVAVLEIDEPYAGYITAFCVVPDTTSAPINLYDIRFLDWHRIDTLQNLGQNLGTTSSGTVLPQATQFLGRGILVVENAVTTPGGTAVAVGTFYLQVDKNR